MFTRTTSAIAFTAVALAATTAADAAFILSQSIGALDADARINSLTLLNPIPDPDPGIIPWDDSMSAGAGSGANSASSSSGQTITDFVGDSFSGEGSSNASATANSQNFTAAHGVSAYGLEFTVDAPMKIDLDWSFFSASTGAGSFFDTGWTILADDVMIAGVEVDETSPMIEWTQSGSYSLDAQPGVTYEFGIATQTIAHANFGTSNPFAATAGQWAFTFTIPTPSTLALLAPMGLLANRRRRR